MKISVVTVCLNAARTVRQSLESFFRQDHTPKELVVVDGGSTDATLEIVRSFPGDDVTVLSEPDDGVYDAMNKGLRRFTGDAVGFLNSDDRFKDDHVLSDIARAMEDADIVHGSLDFVSDDDRDGRVVRCWHGTPFRKGAFLRGWMPPHPTFYARRAVVETVGLFDPRYRIAADYDYMLRALELYDFRSAFIDRALVEMRPGGMSTSSLKSYMLGNFESLRSRQRWLAAGPVDAALVAKPLRKLPQLLAQLPRREQRAS